jgi:hypothetical protein
MQPPVATAGDNRFAGELRAVHKEQQRDGGRRQPFKERDEPAASGKNEASKTVTTRVSVNGSTIRNSFIMTPENRCRYCAFFHLRNKIDLLHPFMN